MCLCSCAFICYSTCMEVERQLFSLLQCELLGFNSRWQLWQQRPSPADLYLANAQYLNLKMMHLSIMLTSGWTCLACPLNRFKSTGSVPLCVCVRRAPERCSSVHTSSVDRGPELPGSEPSISLIPDWRCSIASTLTVPTALPACCDGLYPQTVSHNKLFPALSGLCQVLCYNAGKSSATQVQGLSEK